MRSAYCERANTRSMSRVFLGVLYDPLSGEFSITRFDGFAAALLDAADIDSASGVKVLEAAGCLGPISILRSLGQRNLLSAASI